MLITCPSCNYTKDVPQEKVPARQVTVTCPRCRQGFLFPAQPEPAGLPTTAPAPRPQPSPATVSSIYTDGAAISGKTGTGRSWANIDLNSLSPRQKGAVIAFVLTIFLLVGVRLWADARARAVPSPNMVATKADEVAVSWGTHIFLYNQEGTRTADLSMPAGTELTHLTYDPDGNLLIGDHRTKQILRRQGDQWRTVVNGAGTIRGAFKFVHYPPAGEIFVTDTTNHRIIVYSYGGQFLRAFAKEGKGPGELKFPNEISLLDGDLLVVNTNAGRLDLFSTDGRFLKTVLNTEHLGTYQFPTLLTWLDNGSFAYLLTVDLYDAKALAHAKDGTSIGEFIPPHPLRDAGDIAFWNGKTIITDTGTRQVYTFDPYTFQYLGPLNRDLELHSADAHREASLYRNVARGTLLLLAGLCIWVGVVFYRWQRGQVVDPPVTSLDVTADSGIMWGVPTDKSRFPIMVVTFCVLVWLRVIMRLAHLSTHTGAGAVLTVATLVATPICIVLFFRSLMTSGLANPARIERLQALTRRVWPRLQKSLSQDERIIGCTAVNHSQWVNERSVLALTTRRLLVAGFRRDVLKETIHGISSLPYEQIEEVRIEPTKLTSGWASRLLKIEQFVMTVTPRPGATWPRTRFYGYSREILERVQGAIGDSKRALDVTVGGTEPVSVTEPAKGNTWKPVILSALFPGLGQFHNRQILKGGLLAAIFSAQIVLLTIPVIKLLDHSAELRSQDMPIFAQALGSIVIIWLLAVADAWRTAKSGGTGGDAEVVVQ